MRREREGGEEREDRRAHESRRLFRLRPLFFRDPSPLVSRLNQRTRSFPSVLITNRFDRHFPLSPISPLLLLSLKNIIVRYISLSLFLRGRDSLFLLETAAAWKSRLTAANLSNESERERESFSLVFDLIERYKSVPLSLVLSPSLSVFIRADDVILKMWKIPRARTCHRCDDGDMKGVI